MINFISDFFVNDFHIASRFSKESPRDRFRLSRSHMFVKKTLSALIFVPKVTLKFGGVRNWFRTQFSNYLLKI